LGDTPSPGFGQLLRQFVDITLLKRGPDDLPASTGVLAATVGACAAVNLLAGGLLPPQPGQPLVLLAIDTLMMLLWVWLLLKLARKPERFLQTATGMFGVQLLLAPLFAVALWVFLRAKDDQGMQLPGAVLILALGLWALVVTARILKSATGWPTFACIALVLAQALVTRGLVLLLYPDMAPAVT
jgi:cytochrome bd-type quinol oxidase subunit 2